MAKRKKEQPRARVIIRNARGMSVQERQELAGWLRRMASDLRSDGENYQKLYVARYW